MIRIVLENLILFMTPTLIYLAYAYLTRDAEPASGSGGGTVHSDRPASLLEGAPFIALFMLGAILVLTGMFAFGSTSGGKPGQHYSPAVIKDGRIVPGHTE
jgi:Family of unknown function (DUF6111)